MFPARYFAPRYFAPRYFCKHGFTPPTGTAGPYRRRYWMYMIYGPEHVGLQQPQRYD